LVRSIFEVPIQPNAVIGAETVALMAYIFYVMDRGPHRSVGGTISGPGQEMAA
jgi:hypothetical protein